jgi:hypothetical protein
MIKLTAASAATIAIPTVSDAAIQFKDVAASEVPFPFPDLNSRMARYKKYDRLMMEPEYFNKGMDLMDKVQEKLGLKLNKYNAILCDLAAYGDCFVENKPTEAIWGKMGEWIYCHPHMRIGTLPPYTMYRIETTTGKLLEFQQTKEGPDYSALINNETSNYAIRFKPKEIIHLRVNAADPSVVGEHHYHNIAAKKSPLPFYPYGYSPLEAWSNGKEVDFKKFCNDVEKAIAQLNDPC